MGNKSAKGKKNPTELTQQEIKFLLDNTHYSLDEIKRWHEGFLKDCPSGVLDKKKFAQVFQEVYPQGKAEKYSQQVFNVFDVDKSGKIDFTEFLIAVSTSSNSDIKSKLRLGFRLYDTNSSKSIDKKEMEKMLTAIYDLKGIDNRKGENSPKERVTAIFNKLDKDHNGNISEEEFISGCMQDPILTQFLIASI